MTILEWIDYGFIVVFFLCVGALIVMIAGPRDAVAAGEKSLPLARRSWQLPSYWQVFSCSFSVLQCYPAGALAAGDHW